MARERSEFRQFLVNLFRGDHTHSPKENEIGDILMKEEEEKLKYYYYIRTGIDLQSIAPLEKCWIDKIINWVNPFLLKRNEKCLKHLINEIKDDYLFNVKKAMIDFALKDPYAKDIEIKENLYFKKELKAVPKPWAKRFITNKKTVHCQLYLLNPCLRKLLYLWQQEFPNLSLFDRNILSEQKQPLELEEFKKIISNQINEGQKKLLERWHSAIVALLFRANKKNLIPNNPKFYNCLSTVMSSQLRELCLDSLNKYTDFLCTIKDHTFFKVKLIAKHEGIELIPSLDEFKEKVISFLDLMMKAVSNFSRIDNALGITSQSVLIPNILPVEIQLLQDRLLIMLEENWCYTVKYSSEFAKYCNLLGEKEERKLNILIAKVPKHSECARIIDNYHEISDSIKYAKSKLTEPGIFEVDGIELLETLTMQITDLQQNLLKYMINIHQNATEKLVNDFEELKNQILTTPENTEELMKSQEFIKRVEIEHIPQLREKIAELAIQIIFFASNIEFTTDDIVSNSEPFRLLSELPDIISEHRKMINERETDFQQLLKEQKIKFTEELDFYGKQIKELVFQNKIEEIDQYLKRAQILHNQLQNAADIILHINKEEEAYDLEVTNYPIRQTLLKQLDPYLKLYEAAVDFYTKFKIWTQGPMKNVDAELIEHDISSILRTLFKLERTFSDVPDPLKIIMKVKADIDEFRKHMPLIQTICNPGLKDRHWEEMSNLIGFELKHTEETTLDDMFEYHIEEYIPHIAGISDVATKEYNLEKSYLKMKQEWENTRFILGIHGDTETNILLSVDDIQQMLDDQIVKTGTMISSPYIKPFENDIKLVIF
ncbi:dynein axonemal heavy chain 7-like [Centruroides vittatus]|uniref:dynein axonemal heavy chain 7-like n=1 Tax=Centruroides vittatus TaxID=120091 RepID=UPI0035104E58